MNVKGIYGEDYHTLRHASSSLDAVKVTQQRNGYTIHKHKNDAGYLVLPMAYRDGMQAYEGDKKSL